MEKLVRDNFVGILQQEGKKPEFRITAGDELLHKLSENLIQSVDTFVQDDSQENMAEILEMLFSISHVKDYDMNNIENIRVKKREEFGGYDGGLIMEVPDNEE